MKKLITVTSIGILATLTGCNEGTSGGPGVSDSSETESRMGQWRQAEDTFSLDLPMRSAKLAQGESEELTIGINRGTNFSEDVTLNFAELPEGVTLRPGDALIEHGDKNAKLQLTAADDAAVGDFTIKVTGHPTTGVDAVAELTVTVAQRDSKEIAKADAEAQKERLDANTTALQRELDDHTATYNDLVDRAAEAEGDAKADIDRMITLVKVKMDATAAALAELKSDSADRAERLTESTDNASHKTIPGN